MRNKKIKWIVTIVLAVLCVVCVTNIVFADNFDFGRFDNDSNDDADDAAQNIMGTGIVVVRTVGTGISIAMLSYIGIKYMLASPSEKADFKKSATIYVVGAILVFAGSNILAIIATFAKANGLA